MKLIISTIAVIGATVLSACSSAAPAHPASHKTASAVAAATPTAPAGCQEAMLVTGAVRMQLEGGQPDFHAAIKQLRALGKSVPDSTLRLDIDRANVDLAFFWERAATGENGNSYAKGFAADLRQIDTYCGSSPS